ncbi:MAG: exonuclease domain-containing protein [Saprospiraceae bacterium]|nr:exonuclease domain-containing protein [Saprospiraceae bacterium]
MNYIVFDLEATCWEGKPTEMVQEIIEIGALKLNEYGEVEGSFNSFIRPVLHPNLSLFCRQLTTIDQISINRARLFPDVVEDFQEWAGVFDDEDCLFCSWGSFDRNMLIQDSTLHSMDSEWIETNHLNVRRQYHDMKRWKTYKGLKKVVEMEGFEFTGVYHRAISDAENLAKVFVKHIDEWRS